MEDPRLDVVKANDGTLLFSAMTPASGIRFNAAKENRDSRFNDLSEVPIAARDKGGQYLPRYSLYLYQRLAINWMEYIETRYRSGAILGDYMGLGKTLTLTVHIARHHKVGQKTLIVCPANVVGGWVDHLVKKDFILRDSLEKMGNRVMVLGNGGINNYMNTPSGTMGVVYNRDNPYKLLRTYEMITEDYWEQAGFVIMSYNQLRRDFTHPTMQRLLSQCWERIVFDEAHELRNMGVRPQAAMALKSEFTWAVTATPVHLGVHDFLALILLTKNPLLERRRVGSFNAFELPPCPAAVPNSKDYKEYVSIRDEMVSASKSNNNNSRTWRNAIVYGAGHVNLSAYDMLEVLHMNAFFLQRFPSTVLPIPGNTRPLLTLPRRTDELQRLHFMEYSDKRIRLGVIPVRNPQTSEVSNQDVTMSPADLYLEDGKTYRRLYVERIQAVNWHHNPYKNDPRRREDPEVLTMVWYMKSLIAETHAGRSTSASSSLLEGSQAFGFQRINQQRAAALHPLLVIPAVAPGTDIKLANEFIENVVEPFHIGGPIAYALGKLTVHESVEQPTDDPSSIEVDLSADAEEFGPVQTESRRKERWDDFIDKLMIDDMRKGKVDPGSVSDESVRIARANDVAIRFIENTSACTDVNLPYEGLLRDAHAFAGSDMCDDLIPVEVLRRVRELLVNDPSKLPAMNPDKRENDIKRIDVVLRQRTNSHNFYSFPIRMRILMYAMNQPWHDIDSAYIGEERFRPAQWSPKIWAIVKRVMQIRAARHYEYKLPDGREVVGYERIVIFTQNMGMSYLISWALANLGKLNPETADKLAVDIGVPDLWKRKPNKDNVVLVNGQTPEDKEIRVKILRSFDKDPKLEYPGSVLQNEFGKEDVNFPNYDLFRKEQILVITMRVGGVGLNLDSANHVIVCDPWYNPQLVDQAIARCYRVTQARELHVYRMVMNRTPESTIYDKENARREFASTIMRRLAEPTTGDAAAANLTELGKFYESMRRVEESAAFEQSMRSITYEEWTALSKENLPAEDKMHRSFESVSPAYSTTPAWNALPIKAEEEEVLGPVKASRIRRAADVTTEEEELELAKFVSSQPMADEPEYFMMPSMPVGEVPSGKRVSYPMQRDYSM